MSGSLRVLSIGAGAIGTYIGGSLALDGHYVVFLEQPQVAVDLRQKSFFLRFNGVQQEITKPNVVGSLDEAVMMGPYDVALFALKSYDTQSALESFEKYTDKLPPFMCLSNGVENEQMIAKVLGIDKAIYGTVTSAIGRCGAGDIEVEKLRGMGVAAGHPLSEGLVQALDGAGLKAELYKNALDMKWSKMLTNLIANASSAILDMTPAEIFAHRGLYYLEISMLRETLAVMRHMCIKVVNLPGTPVKALALAVNRLPLSLSRPFLGKSVGGGRGEKMPSFHIDLHSGRGNSEVGYLNGAVVRAGEEAGIPTPANLLLNETLTALTLGHEDLETFKGRPEKLLGEF